MFKFRSLRIAALAAGIAFAGVAGPALSKTVMNLGWATPLDSSNGVFAEKFAERVKELTHGNIIVRLRPSAQIATEDDAVKAMQLGTVDGYLVTNNNISPHFGLADVFVLPYIFRDYAHAQAVLDGEVGDYVKKKFFAQTGIHLITYNAISSRDFYNVTRPINSMKDMDGLKIRVPKNQVMIATYKAFGAEPIPMAWSETPTALQTRTIDGADNGTSVILETKLYEFAKNLCVLDHFTTFTPFLASDAFMSRLSKDDAALFRQAAMDAQAHQRKIMSEQIEAIRSELVSIGMVRTDPDRADFIAAAESVQTEYARDKGEDFKDLIKQIRAVGK